MRSTVSLRMSINGTTPQRVWIWFFSLRRFRGSATAGNGVSLIAPWRRSAISSQLHVGQRGVQGLQLGAHLLTQLVDELGRIQWFAQRPVVLDAAFLEVER